ncbi:MAG TPA: hypothetical protein VLK22_02805 [Candidatus Udaeobacter sp.]|nr:hypothetical protein [Candidatus Udaeobacter sp.]
MSDNQGLFVIISSPTGGGKDTVIEHLVKIFPNSTRLITTTSRSPRPTDQQGVTYNFISKEDFEAKIKQDYFLEYNNFAGNYYGTPKNYLSNLLKQHSLVFSNIDVNGKHSLDRLEIANLSCFLLPESMEILKNRAKKRGGMTEQMLEDRMKIGLEEIAKAKDYDYQVTNYEGKLDQTVDTIAKIIKKHLGNSLPVDKK